MPSSIPSAKEARRTRISAVATELFLERGFDGVSIADIAAAASVSKMTVTNHFTLKEDLVFDEFVGELAQVRDAVASATDLAGAIGRLEDYCDRRAKSGPVARSLSSVARPGRWQHFAHLILDSRALSSRFHAHYLDVRDVIAAELPGKAADAQRDTAAWMLAETLHLIEWWPIDAVRRGLPPNDIESGWARIRTHAFAAVRAGIL